MKNKLARVKWYKWVVISIYVIIYFAAFVVLESDIFIETLKGLPSSVIGGKEYEIIDLFVYGFFGCTLVYFMLLYALIGIVVLYWIFKDIKKGNTKDESNK